MNLPLPSRTTTQCRSNANPAVTHVVQRRLHGALAPKRLQTPTKRPAALMDGATVATPIALPALDRTSALMGVAADLSGVVASGSGAPASLPAWVGVFSTGLPMPGTCWGDLRLLQLHTGAALYRIYVQAGDGDAVALRHGGARGTHSPPSRAQAAPCGACLTETFLTETRRVSVESDFASREVMVSQCV